MRKISKMNRQLAYDTLSKKGHQLHISTNMLYTCSHNKRSYN